MGMTVQKTTCQHEAPSRVLYPNMTGSPPVSRKQERDRIIPRTSVPNKSNKPRKTVHNRGIASAMCIFRKLIDVIRQLQSH